MNPLLAAMMVRDCLCSALENSLGGEVCRCSIYPSAVHTADICERSASGHGEAKVSITGIYDSLSFPDPISFGENCGNAYTVVEVTQTVWRCAPVISDDGDLPSVTEIELASAVLLDDARAMRCAIQCCLNTKLVEIGTWTLLPAQGGCVGGRLVALVGLDTESCFEAESV